MAAEVATGGCTSLRAQLENARVGLQRLERDIRRAAQLNAAQRYHTDRNSDRGFQNSNNARGGRQGKPNFYQEGLNQRNFNEERLGKKRTQETKTVFSRLSTRPSGDSDIEEESTASKKPRLSSQVIRDLPTKQEVLKAQEGDEQSKARNRRMFGSLLGTLQKFKQEAIVLQNKEDKKAQVEKKIEEQAKQEKENQKKERQNLFAEREIKKATIKALEAKMVRMREFEKWEMAHTMMLGFIQTKGKPPIFWKPKRMSEQAQEKLANSKKALEKTIEKKRQDVATELNAIEQRCLRNMRLPPGSQLRPTSLSDSAEFVPNDNNIEYMEDNEASQESVGANERVHSTSMNIKEEKDDAEKKFRAKSEVHDSAQIKQEKQGNADKNISNGKSQSNERWNREHSDSSSDENEENSNGNDEKNHSMDESSRPANDNSEKEAVRSNSKDREEVVPSQENIAADISVDQS